MAEEKLQNLTNEKALLPAWYYEAFGLRIMGLGYDQIAERTGRHPVYVRSLFSKNGALFKFWRLYADEHKSEAQQEIMDMMWGHVPDIVRTRIVLAKTLGMGSNDAAKIILNYTLGNPDKSLIQNNIQIINNETQITGFNYIIPNDPNNKTDLETALGIPSIEGPEN